MPVEQEQSGAKVVKLFAGFQAIWLFMLKLWYVWLVVYVYQQFPFEEFILGKYLFKI